MTTKSDSKLYWIGKEVTSGKCCPNVSLFRLVGLAGISIQGSRVLEIGFGANFGEDLLEFSRRGATCMGIDINPSYVDYFNQHYQDISVVVIDCSKELYPAVEPFDLIYSMDMLYYLNDDEIDFHFKNTSLILNNGGYFIVQIIEEELGINFHCGDSSRFNLAAFQDATSSRLVPDENPIRYLDVDWLIHTAKKYGLSLVGRKLLLESHGNEENNLRVNRYLMFKK